MGSLFPGLKTTQHNTTQHTPQLIPSSTHLCDRALWVHSAVAPQGGHPLPVPTQSGILCVVRVQRHLSQYILKCEE